MGVRSPRGECTVLLGTRWNYAYVPKRAAGGEHLWDAGIAGAGFHAGLEEDRESNRSSDPGEILATGDCVEKSRSRRSRSAEDAASRFAAAVHTATKRSR